MTRRERAAAVPHFVTELRKLLLSRRIEHADLQVHRRLDSLSECLHENHFAAPHRDRKPIAFVTSDKLSAHFTGNDNLLSRRWRVIVITVQHHRHVGHANDHRRMTAGKVERK